MHHDVATDPSNLLLPRVQPPRRAALASFLAEPAPRLIPLYSESGTYREWVCTVDRTEYTVVDDDGTWTLMVYVPTCLEWVDVPGMDVDTFLATHRLILAA